MVGFSLCAYVLCPCLGLVKLLLVVILFQIQLVEKQKNLGSLITKEQEHTKEVTPPPSDTPPDLIEARDLEIWREDTPPEENSLHVFNYDQRINSILSLHHGDITLLACDMLVVPLQKLTSNLQESTTY